MVADMHDNALACHTGVDRTLSQLKNRVYWPDQDHRFDAQVILHVDVHLQALLEDGLKSLDCLEYQAGGEQASTAFELITQVDLEVGAALRMCEYQGDNLGQAVVDIRLKYNGVAVGAAEFASSTAEFTQQFGMFTCQHTR